MCVAFIRRQTDRLPALVYPNSESYRFILYLLNKFTAYQQMAAHASRMKMFAVQQFLTNVTRTTI